MPFHHNKPRRPQCPYCMDGEIIMDGEYPCCNQCNYIVILNKSNNAYHNN